MCLCVLSEKVTIVTNAGAQFSKPSVCCSPSSPPGLRKKDMKADVVAHVSSTWRPGQEDWKSGLMDDLGNWLRSQENNREGLTARQNQSISVC